MSMFGQKTGIDLYVSNHFQGLKFNHEGVNFELMILWQ